MTVGITDGETSWAFRYSWEDLSRSLFQSTGVSPLRAQHPDDPVLPVLGDGSSHEGLEWTGVLWGRSSL
jgi:hypothetical protein